MKILFLTLPCFADNSFSLIHAFQQQGHDVTCLLDLTTLSSTVVNIKKKLPCNNIVSANEYQELRFFDNYLDINRFYVANFHITTRLSPNIIRKTLKLYQFIRNGRFDIIHIDHNLERSDQFLYFLYGRKMVFTRHDPLPHSGMEFSSTTKKMLARAYKYVPKIVIHNEAQKEQFCKLNGIVEERVLVNNMCPYDCMELYMKGKPKRDDGTILFFGRISKYKGLEYLCDAMVQVHNVLPQAKLIIAGGGSLYFDYTPYKDLEYIQLNNSFVETDELVLLLQKCTFVVCPYADATQSGVVMTCNAIGVPVIATKVGGLPGMIDNERSGIIVEPKNSGLLAESIIRLLSNKRELESMYNYVVSMYKTGSRSSHDIVRKYIDFYNKKI